MENVIENKKENTVQGAVSPESRQKISKEALSDVPVEVSVELGRVRIPFSELLSIETGSVISLNKSPQEPVGIFANGKKIGEGEMVMLEEFSGIRILKLEEARK